MNNTLEIVINARDNATKQLRALQGELKALQKATRSVGGAFKSMGSKIAGGFVTAVKQARWGVVALGAGVAMLGKRAFDVAGDIQQYQLALEGLLGSQEKAREAMRKFKQDAARTPFDLRDVVKANQMLISAGESVDGAREAVLALGNAIVATGGGMAEFKRMVGNLQQMKNVGKATARDMLQFGYAGINIQRLLKEASKKTGRAFTESYEDVVEALKIAQKEGGFFAGALEKQGNSWNLVKSNLNDVINIILSDFLMSTGVFEIANKGLIKLVDGLTAVSQKMKFFIGLLKGNLDVKLMKQLGFHELDRTVIVISNIGKALRELPEAFKTGDLEEFKNTLRTIGLGEGVVQAIGTFIDYMRAFGNFVKEHKEEILKFLEGFAIGLGSLMIVSALGMAFSALTSPIMLVAAAIGLLYTAWTQNWGGIQEKTKVVWEWLKPKLEELWNLIIYLKDQFVANFNMIRDRITKWYLENKETLDKILLNVKVIMKFIWFHIKFYLTLSWTFWKTTFKILWAIVKGTMHIIGVLIKAALKFITGLINLFGSILRGDWQGAWDAVKQITSSMWDTIKAIFWEIPKTIASVMDEVVRAMIGGFEEAWNKAKEYAEKIRHAIASAFDKDKRNSPSIMDTIRDMVVSVNAEMGKVRPVAQPQVVNNISINASVRDVSDWQDIGSQLVWQINNI